MSRRITSCFLVAAAFSAGCASEEPTTHEGADVDLAPPGHDISPQDVSDNGTSLNGTSLNGTSLNGTSLNGTSLNGTSLNGTSLNGTSLNGTSLNGTFFSATTASGMQLYGTMFTGTVWSGQLSNGSTVPVRVVDVRSLASPNADLLEYKVEYETTMGWRPLCGLDSSQQPIWSIPMPGLWNSQQGVAGGGSHTPSTTSFTFACRGAAIAKCVELGYRPWNNIAGTSTSLQNHLTACTRALRADYCGDGTSYTVNGTLINLYDNVGIQADTQSWPIEAEWTASGARFLTPAWTTMRYQSAGAGTPPCLSALTNTTAGFTSHFSSGTLIMNEH